MRRRTLMTAAAAAAASVLGVPRKAGASDELDLIADDVVVIARWRDPNGHTIELQNFVLAGESFIPLFSDEARFRDEAAGSGFEHEGVAIKLEFLVSLLRGDELLILNPASTRRRLRKSDLQDVLQRRAA